MLRRLYFIISIAAVLAGCDKGPSLKTFPVKGTVTYNGRPVAGATVAYIAKGNIDAPRATGTTDPEGQFSLTTYAGPTELLGGAVPGEYQVSIMKETANVQAAAASSENMSNSSPQDRSEMMSKMWADQKKGSPESKRAPATAAPKPEIPLKYAKPDTSGLTATVLSGENEPREFKLTDD